jgi:hypothetical protein
MSVMMIRRKEPAFSGQTELLRAAALLLLRKQRVIIPFFRLDATSGDKTRANNVKTVWPHAHARPRRNVRGTLQVVPCPQPSLSIMDSYNRIVESPMQHSIDQVTLHPSNEWLVVAGGGQLQVWIARKLPKRRCNSSNKETL